MTRGRKWRCYEAIGPDGHRVCCPGVAWAYASRNVITRNRMHSLAEAARWSGLLPHRWCLWLEEGAPPRRAPELPSGTQATWRLVYRSPSDVMAVIRATAAIHEEEVMGDGDV